MTEVQNKGGAVRKLSITFQIHYRTSDPEDAIFWYDEHGHKYKMTSEEDGLWTFVLRTPIEETVELRYNYRLYRGDRVQRVEPLIPHTLRLSLAPQELQGEVTIYDRWLENTPWHRFTDAPLAELLGLPDISRYRIPTFDTTSGDAFAFNMLQPMQEELLMVGAIPSCGSWDPKKAIPLSLTRNAYILQFPERKETEYKLILRSNDGKIIWEEGDNRVYRPDDDGVFTLRYDRPPAFKNAELPMRKQLTGTAIPLFSLRSEQSYGIGDLSDAEELLNWMCLNRQSVLQLLPFYDTTFTRTDKDSYPYSAITTYGLHPIYMDVRQLPGYKNATDRMEWERTAAELNRLSRVDYSATLNLKEKVMDYCFEWWYDTEYETDQDFAAFIEKEGASLLSYALFCTIRDRLPGTPVEQYPPYSAIRLEWIEHRSCMGNNVEKEVTKHCFRQFHLYKQLEQLCFKAAGKGILLKGDLPIGANRNSEDVWVAKHLFCLDKEAGSPPDAFSAKGQDWAFPTYDWEAMKVEGYEWWRKRFATMGRYLDAIRIDHILGFFRIWSIPAFTGDPSLGHYVPAKGFRYEEVKDVQAFFNQDKEGYYHPLLAPEHRTGWDELSEEKQIDFHRLKEEYYHGRNEALWRETAIERLSNIMSAGDMLICAEDLGVLTASITDVLSSLEILSLEVLRMPKQLGQKYILPNAIPELGVLTTSTHDMDSLRCWWQELLPADRCELARLYGFENDITPRGLIRSLHRTRAVLMILPLQDWFVMTGYGNTVAPQDERINYPDDPNHIWNYRMPGFISELTKYEL